MKFPKTFEEFIKQYSFFDKQQIYTNGSELIHVFRIKQWEEHKEKENQELKKQYCERTDCSARLGTSKKVETLEKEIEELKKQLEYLRSGEYLNQLKFERDMLQHIVENSEVSKEDKEFIDMTHRNTELLEQQKEFIKWLEDYLNLFDEKDIYEEGSYDTIEEILQKYKEIVNGTKQN